MVIKKQEEASNSQRDKSFKFPINSIGDINILCHKKKKLMSLSLEPLAT